MNKHIFLAFGEGKGVKTTDTPLPERPRTRLAIDGVISDLTDNAIVARTLFKLEKESIPEASPVPA